jgi:DNA repair protein RAD50
VLKGRLPPEKDMKREIVQALRSIEREYDDLSLKSREAEKEVNMLQMKIQEVNNSLFKHNKDTESRKRYIESKLQALKQESVTIDAYPKLLESAKDKRDDRKRFVVKTGDCFHTPPPVCLREFQYILLLH